VSAEPAELDVVIPVYNEGDAIVRVLRSLDAAVRTRLRVLICYDRDDDTTLTALRDYRPEHFEVRLLKNRGQGALGAVLGGFEASTAPAVVMLPADDDYNAPRLDAMVREFRSGCDVVVACRFMPGGHMGRGPLLKTALCRAVSWAMHTLLGLPARDATNGFRLFSRRVLERVPIETTAGFAWSLELLVKCHRLGWKVGEVPAHWYERPTGRSRFRVFRWAPHYLRWVAYAAGTSLGRRGPGTVRLRPAAPGAGGRAA
jgi:glycosyltransferase involved in cell wall biosynthesis